jgi:SAM-dependent methyltransferase
LENQTFDPAFWSSKYLNSETQWDLGAVSPALKIYIDQLTDKHVSILIPGCGNAHEAKYLLEKGFSNITVIDIAPEPIAQLKLAIKDSTRLNLICGDFFEFQGQFDLILEQTFFCALPPTARKAYAIKMHQLLKEGGKLVGLLFNRNFEQTTPPFGGNLTEYQRLFTPLFSTVILTPCTDSHPKRQGTELFMQCCK